MISEIQGYSSFMMPPQMPPRGEDVELTDEEQQTVEEILAEYDTENLTDDEFHEMMEALKEAGIKPCEDLKEIFDEAGVDPGEHVDASKRPPPPPPQGMMGMLGGQSDENSPVGNTISDFIEKYNEGSLTDEDLDAFVKRMSVYGASTTGVLLNIEA